MIDRTKPHVPDQPHVERERGPYETTVIHVAKLATAVITLPAETDLAAAIQKGHEYLAQCNPGVQVQVHRWEKGAHPSADPTPEQLVHHVWIDKDGAIRPALGPTP